jgi:hypothetical protein
MESLALVDAIVAIDEEVEVVVGIFKRANFVTLVYEVPRKRSIKLEHLMASAGGNDPRLLRSEGNLASSGKPDHLRRNMVFRFCCAVTSIYLDDDVIRTEFSIQR